MRVSQTAALFAAFVSVGAAARAQPPSPFVACKPEIRRLCAGVKPGAGRILRCLDNHLDRASGVCRSAVGAYEGKIELQRDIRADRREAAARR